MERSELGDGSGRKGRNSGREGLGRSEELLPLVSLRKPLPQLPTQGGKVRFQRRVLGSIQTVIVFKRTVLGGRMMAR